MSTSPLPTLMSRQPEKFSVSAKKVMTDFQLDLIREVARDMAEEMDKRIQSLWETSSEEAPDLRDPA